jgi:type IV pilus assembly protein PilZ
MPSLSSGFKGNNILDIAIREKSALYAAYMPFIKNGGLFIPTTAPHRLGEEVFMLLSLMDEKEKIPISGTIVWVTPIGASSSTAGIGVCFSDLDKGQTRNKIENYLAAGLKSDRKTQTM